MSAMGLADSTLVAVAAGACSEACCEHATKNTPKQSKMIADRTLF